MEKIQRHKKTITFGTNVENHQKDDNNKKKHLKSRNENSSISRNANTVGEMKNVEKKLLVSIGKNETCDCNKKKINEEINFKSIPEKLVNTDQYGFIKENNNEQKEKESLLQLNARIEKWNYMLTNFKEYTTVHFAKLKTRTRKGIPDNLRCLAWQKLADIDDYYVKDLYKTLNNEPVKKEIETIIERDLDRTFPECEFFKEKYGNGQRQLYKVLCNYSKYNQEIGYVQGMAFITAVLLTYMDEERTFFMLHSLMKKYQMDLLYAPGFPDMKKRFFVLLNLEKKFVPKVYNAFVESEVIPNSYASDWFLSLFSRSLEFKVLVRIFDTFLLEGFKVIYRFSLAILKIKEKELTNNNEGVDSIFLALTNVSKNIDVEELFKTAFGFGLSKKEIEILEKEYEKVQNDKDNEFIKQL